jgi:hypothetical protein
MTSKRRTRKFKGLLFAVPPTPPKTGQSLGEALRLGRGRNRLLLELGFEEFEELLKRSSQQPRFRTPETDEPSLKDRPYAAIIWSG